MELILILGPMKSGKSFELINYFAPLQYTEMSYGLYQSEKNIRDENIWSRNGIQIKATKVKSLTELLKENKRVIGLDEIHMFNEKDADIVDKLLKDGVKVIASGLDMDYRGKMFPIVQNFLSLGPIKVKYKRAVCEICKDPQAIYTQIFENFLPVTGGLPSVIPDDGTYSYQPVCRQCFKKAS